MTFCFNCMEEIEEDQLRCPYCGADPTAHTLNQRALPPLTILNGKYITGRVIGEGGFGITYLARDLNLKLKVAIKEYFPIQCASRNTAEGGSNNITVITGDREKIFRKGYEDYEKEARRLAALDDLPGIVKVMNFFYENNTAYMVMEYIQGQTLREIFSKKKDRNSWKHTLDIMEPVIRSLAIVHQNGIIHRDISPDNIMVRDDGQITLIDFGAAREMSNDGKSMTIALKHGYAPPEQYQTHGNQGPWTDVYAICATIYRLISGEVLPDAMSLYTGSKRIQPLHDSISSVPGFLDRALIKGLSPRIDDRIKNMNELHSYLYEGRKVVPWKKIMIAGAAVVAALLLVVIGGGVLNGIKSAQRERYVEEEGYDEIREDEDSEKSGIINTTVEEKDDQSEDDPAPTDGNVTETVDDPEEETAVKYIADNGMTYTPDSMISTAENDKGLTITSTDYTVVDVVIPAEVNGNKVTAIRGIGSNVTSLVLPDTLERIEANAFKNCVYMESIFIPASVTYIGSNAFENCQSLTEIHISAQNKMFSEKDGHIVDNDGNVIF